MIAYTKNNNETTYLAGIFLRHEKLYPVDQFNDHVISGDYLL